MASRAATLIPLEEDAWFTASELEDLGLPGLPGDKRSINRRAQTERWTSRLGPDGQLLVRKRQGRGGGVEFHASLLPGEARIELARRGLIRTRPEPAAGGLASAWAWFDKQPKKVKAEAQRRLDIITAIALLCEAGSTRTSAIAQACDDHGISRATIWNWLRAVEGIERSDWLVALAPRRQGGGAVAEIHPELWKAFKSDYLRPEAPTLTSVYRRVGRIAKSMGISMPHERTFRRRLDREIPAEVLILKREGVEALRRATPANRRSVRELQAMEWINIDGHVFDVFVRLPAGRIVRPTMIAMQDVYSRKIVAFRIGTEESAVNTRLCFADLFREWGIPGHVVMDNGRGFNSKWLTGGTDFRFRFKARAEDPIGLLPGLGVKTHATLPFRGQSKPIERAFRDMCADIAKHPEFHGAYTGNNPMAKPENYGNAAVDWDRFCEVVANEIAEHNARPGRRTEVAQGRSFDQAFAESYAVAPITKVVDPVVLRMALLAAEAKKVNKTDGTIEIAGNRYYHPDLIAHRGELVTVRFDPDNLHSPIHVYQSKGPYIVEAMLLADTGFGDIAGAQETARRTKNMKRRAKELAEAERLLSPEELAALQVNSCRAAKPEATVIQPRRHAAHQARQNTPKPEQGSADVLPIDRMRLGLAKFAAGQN
ncbi:MAG: Mu transposase C-terminal domain-containing protein [Porphyrobacter sp.]|nr:Mu transposase C-terminal domain-containing protein [Porphyrobacter sp.]